MKYILIVLFFAACIPPYQPYRYLTDTSTTYDNEGSPALKIECKQSIADCLQEAGYICQNDGYQIVHNESMNRGSISESHDNSGVYKIGDAVIASSGSEAKTTNIQDNYLIIKCNTINSIKAFNDLKEFRNKQESERYLKYQDEHCGKPGYPACKNDVEHYTEYEIKHCGRLGYPICKIKDDHTLNTPY